MVTAYSIGLGLRLLHVSDIHCAAKKLFRILETAIPEHNPELIVVTGDICCDGKLVSKLTSYGVRVIAVTGNMDDLHIARVLKDHGVLLDGRLVVIGDYVFAGIGGLQPVQDTDRVLSLLRKENPDSIVVVAHHPIHGYLDVTWSGVHAGLYETRRLVDEVKPIAYLHGHIHEARGVARYGTTLLVNPGPAAHGYYAIVELKGRDAVAKLYTL